MATILIVEDDARTGCALSSGLENEGYRAVHVLTGEDSLSQLKNQSFDAIVLDWMLPGCDGLDVLKALRAGGGRTPVLLLTARDAIEDRVLGLDSGADDYLVKPFAFAELLARLRVMLRRREDRELLEWTIGSLSLDLASRRVMRGSRSITLTPREFDLLVYLVRHHGHIVSRQMLAKDVWRDLQRTTPLDNVIDVHIAHLRRKIDDGETIKLLHTIRGVGFTLSEAAPSA